VSPVPARAARRSWPARNATASAGWDALGALESGVLPRTLYLEGPSEALKAAVLVEIRSAWNAGLPDAPPARVLRAAETSVEEILAAYHGTSLFSPRELTLVFEVEDLGRSEKRVEALAEGLRRPGGESSIVLVESESETVRKSLEPLRAGCEARMVAEPPTRPVLLAWGQRRLKREGLQAEPGVIEAIADASENEALSFFSELSRLTAFAGPGGTLTRKAADDLLRPVVGAGLPDYLAAVAAGDAATAARRLGRLLAAGESEGTILFALVNTVGGALGGWSRHKNISLALARRLKPDALRRAMDALYRVEAAWKGGRADVIALLEQATRTVAAG
jgi:DNA polymerase III delta subunit